MKSEDGTGSRHALVVFKEMWDCHPAYFIQNQNQPRCANTWTIFYRNLNHPDDFTGIVRKVIFYEK